MLFSKIPNDIFIHCKTCPRSITNLLASFAVYMTSLNSSSTASHSPTSLHQYHGPLDACITLSELLNVFTFSMPISYRMWYLYTNFGCITGENPNPKKDSSCYKSNEMCTKCINRYKILRYTIQDSMEQLKGHLSYFILRVMVVVNIYFILIRLLVLNPF